MTSKAVRALAAVLLLATAARADWEGVAKTKIEPPPPMAEGAQVGRIHGKGGKVRIEVNGRMGKGAVIFDGKAKKLTMILEEQRAYLVMDTDGPIAGGRGGPGMQLAVTCEGDDPKPCLEAAGFKKTGSEQVNGQKATKWSRDRETPRGPAHQDLWTPDGFKEFAVVRQVTKTAERTVTLDVEGLKRAPQPDALFKVPAGFQDNSDMMKRMAPGGPGGRPGPGVPPARPQPPGDK